MQNNFRVVALDEKQFKSFFSISAEELSAQGIKIQVVDEYPGFPCRVSLEDANIGEEVILLNYEHHPVSSPYRASGPIYVRKTAHKAIPPINEVPVMLHHRLLSVRGYNKEAMMIFADVLKGDILEEKLHEILNDLEIEYLHIHNAKPGCFNCRVERVI